MQTLGVRSILRCAGVGRQPRLGGWPGWRCRGQASAIASCDILSW